MSLDEYYKAWERRAKRLDAAADAAADAADAPQPPPTVDPRTIRPEDIGVRFGAPMTAEQFAEYRKNRPGRVSVLGAAPDPPVASQR